LKTLKLYEICNAACQKIEAIARGSFKDLELTFQQYIILDHLESPLRPGQLSELCQMSGANLTYITDKMVKGGLIERNLSNEDRRAFVIRRSKNGKILHEKAKKTLEQEFKNEFNLTSNDLKHLEDVMSKIDNSNT
jgi:DNA-binding MarR family transcriptional regulator